MRLFLVAVGAMLLTAAGFGAQSVKTVDGLAIASVKVVDGLAIASVKSISGLDNTAAAGLSISATVWKIENSGGASQSGSVAPTATNGLVVGIATAGGTSVLHAVTDNVDGATGWVKVINKDSGANVTGSIWYKKNIPSGITSITVDGGLTTDAVTGFVHEVVGASATTMFTSGEAGQQDTSSTTNPTTPAVTNATAASAFFALVVTGNATNPATWTVNSTGSTGITWTHRSATNSVETDQTFIPASMPSGVASASASTAHGWTADSANGATLIACFH